MKHLTALLAAAALWPLASVAQIPIGYFGPGDADHAAGGTYWHGAQLAIEEANRQGGYQGEPYRLAQAWDENPWTGGAKVVVRLAYQEKVWAIIGGIDGTSTHLAEQVVAKARLALVDPASTDRSVNAAFVPWMFSLMPDDRVLMAAIGGDLLKSPHRESYVLVVAADHDSRVATVEFLRFMDENQSRPRQRFDFSSGSPAVPQIAAGAAATEATAIVLLAGIEDSARMLRALRRAGFDGVVYGGPAMGRRAFVALAGEAANGVRFPLPSGAATIDPVFTQTYRARFGAAPDYAATTAYDAVRLVVTAIERAGLDRAAIRDALRGLSPWTGTSGSVGWDKIGRATGEAVLAEVINGDLRPR